jgi:hypothetical protein
MNFFFHSAYHQFRSSFVCRRHAIILLAPQMPMKTTSAILLAPQMLMNNADAQCNCALYPGNSTNTPLCTIYAEK